MTPRIPLSAPDITSAEVEAVSAVLGTGRLSLGPQLDAFEGELAAYHGVAHAIAVSSGTAGLHLALVALGIGEGGEVILPSFAFVAVANAVQQVGATPVFAEIDPLTLNLDPRAVEAAITPRTQAILVVHTFGVPVDMQQMRSIADRHGLALIEDDCEAIGATFDGRPTGSFGDLAVLGFYPNKQMTTGEGGAILARNAVHATRLRALRNQGRQPGGDWLDHHELGYNYRLSEMACALGRVQLGRIAEMLSSRRSAAERYGRLLGAIKDVELPPLTLPRRTISWFVYVLRVSPQQSSELRDRLQEALAAEGIATARYFAPIHLQPAWRDHASSQRAHLPLTASIARRTLALPFFNRISETMQAEVARAIDDAMRRM